jgi:carnosine N-methyltransferase
VGGTWINLGPLLYHFEGNDDSVEFTLQEVRFMVQRAGFVIGKEATVPTTYAACPESMMHYLYHNYFFVATKL